MPTSQVVLVALIAGLGLGSIYVLVALSYTLVLSTSGVFNFAQGALVMGGAVGSYVLGVRLGLNQVLVVAILLVAGAAIGFLSDTVAVRPFVGRAGNLTEEAMVSTLGLGLTFAAIGALLFGVDLYRVPSYVTTSIFYAGAVPIRPIFIVLMVVAAIVALVFDRVVVGTRLGLILRAVILDRERAALFGIDPVWVVAIAFTVAGALSAISGYLLAPLVGVSVYVGDQLALFGFVSMAIGGFGSYRGAVAGGMIVGLISGLAPVVLNPQLVQPLLYFIMIGVLIVRPRGLFGLAGQFGTGALRRV